MITKQQVRDLKPAPFTPVLAYTRFKDGLIVPLTTPRFKREWSFSGTHEVTLPDGSKVTRQGQYIVKTKRQ